MSTLARSTGLAAALSVPILTLALAGCGSPESALADGNSATAVPGEDGGARIDFTLPDLEGRPRSLSEWDGNLVLLNFWATWCPPCLREMPLFQEAHERYAARGLTIVAVAVDEVEETRAFVDTRGIGFPVLIGQEDAIAVARDYGNRIGALPYSALIDRSGKIRETHRGEVTAADLARWIDAFL